MTVFFGTIAVVPRLPKSMFDIPVRETNTNITSIFKNSGFLAEQSVREKSSLGSLSRWVSNTTKDGDSSAFLSFCSSVEMGNFKNFFYWGFLISSLYICMNLLCSLLLSISAEESQVLPSTSNLPLPKTENTNPSAGKPRMWNSMPGLTGTV